MPTLEPPVRRKTESPEHTEKGLPMPDNLPRLHGIPGLNDDVGSGTTGEWGVLVFNDDVHTFPQVEFILQQATGCSAERAHYYATEIHAKGKAIVYTGAPEKCNRVATIIEKIGLGVKVVQL